MTSAVPAAATSSATEPVDVSRRYTAHAGVRITDV